LGNRRYISLCVVAFAMSLLVACGSQAASTETAVDSSNNSVSEEPVEDSASIIVDNGGIYTIDDFKAVGYKNVTQFDLETLPGANDAWYGFYSQKDYELRFYESHQAALDQGLEPAEIAVGKGAVGYSKRPPLRFDAFAIVGNVVMLCELSIESCEALIAELN
jgi:hypothetical protein